MKRTAPVLLALAVSLLTLAGCTDDDGGNFGRALGAGLGGAAMYQLSRPVAVPPYQPTNMTCQNLGAVTNCHTW